MDGAGGELALALGARVGVAGRHVGRLAALGGGEDAGRKVRQQGADVGEARAHDADVDLDVGPDRRGRVVAREVGRGAELEQVDDAQDLDDDDEQTHGEHEHDANLAPDRQVERPELRHGQHDGSQVEGDGHDGTPERLRHDIAARGFVRAIPSQPRARDRCALEDGDRDEGARGGSGQAHDDVDAHPEGLLGEDTQVEAQDGDLGEEDNNEIEDLRVVVHLEHKGDVVESHHP